MANNKRLRKVALAQSAHAASGKNLTLREAALLGVLSESEHSRPYVNLKYYWPDHECFSAWSATKLKAFSAFCRKLAQSRWTEIHASGGGLGSKTGFGYTVHKNHGSLPTHPELANLSPDLTWFELRIDVVSRVHGFRVKDAFFLVFLDQSHAIYKG